MAKKLESLSETLCGELEKVAKKEDMSLNDLDIIDKLTHSIKNLDKVMLGNEMIEQYGYDSNNYSRYSGARRGRDGDSDGRYNEGNRRGRSYDGRSYEGNSYNRSYERDYSSNDGYSGHENEIDRFKHMMQDAVNQL